jgi:hypothetical protein
MSSLVDSEAGGSSPFRKKVSGELPFDVFCVRECRRSRWAGPIDASSPSSSLDTVASISILLGIGVVVCYIHKVGRSGILMEFAKKFFQDLYRRQILSLE